MQSRDHSCFFSSAHAAKDSGIAFQLGKDQGLELPLAKATKKQYDRMVDEGLGELDKSGIAELTFKGRHQGKKADAQAGLRRRLREFPGARSPACAISSSRPDLLSERRVVSFGSMARVL